MFRPILFVTAAAISVVGLAHVPSASGQAYGGCQAVVSDTTPSPGDTITVTGSGALPNGPVTADIQGLATIGAGTADGSGSFSFTALIPSGVPPVFTLPDVLTLLVNCHDSGAFVTITLNTSGATTATTTTTTTTVATTTTTTTTTAVVVAAGALARTGSSGTVSTAQAAIAVLLLGGATLGAARLRSRAVRSAR